MDTTIIRIILNLFFAVLHQVNDETLPHGLWNKLETFYLRKTLSNKIYLKKKLFGYKMDTTKTFEANLNDFK